MNDKSLARYVIRSGCSCDVETLKKGLRLSKYTSFLSVLSVSMVILCLFLMLIDLKIFTINDRITGLHLSIYIFIVSTCFILFTKTMLPKDYFENHEVIDGDVYDLEETLEDFKEAFGSKVFHILEHGTSDEVQKAVEIILVSKARSVAVCLVNSPDGESTLMDDFLEHWRLANLFVSSPSYREIEREACPDGDCCGKRLPDNWLG